LYEQEDEIDEMVELNYGRISNMIHREPKLQEMNEKIDFALRLRRSLGLSLTVDDILPRFLPLEISEVARSERSKNWTTFLKLEADLAAQESDKETNTTNILGIQKAYLENLRYDPKVEYE
jgi:hypothetical protein